MDSIESGIGSLAVSANVLDGAMLLLLLAGAVLGYVRGLIRQLVSLLGWIAALLAAYWFHDRLIPLLERLWPLPGEAMAGGYAKLFAGGALDGYIYSALAFAAVFVAARLLIGAAALLLHGVASLPGLRTVNRWSGALLGLLQASVLLALALLVMDALPSPQVRQLLDHSAGYVWLEQNKPSIMAYIGGLWQ